jgi:hypothetical protein
MFSLKESGETALFFSGSPRLRPLLRRILFGVSSFLEYMPCVIFSSGNEVCGSIQNV